ncbi:transcription factor VOZ1 [Heracleum sosnowskyi]|uniref:Transcription factor VOZ1 n=1 Tax=Heracleum sosnowskyi TaxID=360622 RepID=A0AAD8I578_9APIA|nr:transcription factor VOZ1 [Heracleum sosnowskyi]
MRKGTKKNGVTGHQVFKDRAKNRVDDLQGMFSDLQSARKESRSNDVMLLENQVHQMLKEWKSELNQPSPASSFQGSDSLGLVSSEIERLVLQLREEEDDATSGLGPTKQDPDGPVGQNVDSNFVHQLVGQKVDSNFVHQQVGQKVGSNFVHQQDFDISNVPQQQGFELVDQFKESPSGANNARANGMGVDNMAVTTQLDFYAFDMHQDIGQTFVTGFDGTAFCNEDVLPQISAFLPSICPPPSAFLGPKCALWDCPRPAQGWNEDYQDYCSTFHGALAPIEGSPGMTPVLRPGGIGLKDSVLFSALKAKTEGKDVGVPVCEGAATARSPWNVPELFDLTVLEGEIIREWLFFDKPRRAFESGNRKQRSLPDYKGRGWHESRKQVMNEFGGLKRSYYMDPQPMENLEWHLFEYEISKCDACALYRLELKLVDGKKSPKGKEGKVGNDSLADLQKQMGRLTAAPRDKRFVKGRAKSNLKEAALIANSAPNQMAPTTDGFDYGTGAPYDYLVDNLTGYGGFST